MIERDSPSGIIAKCCKAGISVISWRTTIPSTKYPGKHEDDLTELIVDVVVEFSANKTSHRFGMTFSGLDDNSMYSAIYNRVSDIRKELGE